MSQYDITNEERCTVSNRMNSSRGLDPLSLAIGFDDLLSASPNRVTLLAYIIECAYDKGIEEA